MNSKRVLLLIAVWKRPGITDICYQGVRRLESIFLNHGMTLVPFIVHSEDIHADMARRYGFHGAHAENFPVGNKMNEGLAAAMEMEWDYLLQLGSDDLLTDAAADLICKSIEAGISFFGFDQLYFVDALTKKMKLSKYDMVFGAGRCISREIIEEAALLYPVVQVKGEVGPGGSFRSGALHYVKKPNGNQRKQGKKEVYLWDAERNSGLDTSSEARIMKNAKKMPHIIRLPTPGVIDIKSHVNIHSFDALPGEIVDFQVLTPEMRLF